MSLEADYVLGCNPLGMTWITGLGTRSPMSPLHNDAMTFIKHNKGVLPGIPVYGPTKAYQTSGELPDGH